MYVQPSKFLTPTARVIKPYQCSILAVEGPNILGKIDLSGIEIPYDSQFTTRMILNPEAVNQPLFYGFLGNEVTLLLLKITYDETNTQCLIEEEQYIEYFFSDDLEKIRYANKLLILTGNSIKRIPQIYINNPSGVKVIIDAMVANLAQSDLNVNDMLNQTTVSNIYHTNIISNKLWSELLQTYGSTQFQIMNNDSSGNIDIRTSVYLNYNEIELISLNKEEKKLIIDTKSDSVINLTFLSEFYLYQAYSRMEWVLQELDDVGYSTRYVTIDSPGVDVTGPEIVMKTTVEPIINEIYTIPILTTPVSITKEMIIDYFIDYIYDERDGTKENLNANLTIRKHGEITSISLISSVDNYEITMSILDNANNSVYKTFTLLLNNEAPTVVYSQTGNIFTLSLSDFGGTITKNNISGSTITSMNDNLSTILNNYDNTIITSGITFVTCDITINSNSISSITSTGTYTIQYTFTDLSANVLINTKTLIVN